MGLQVIMLSGGSGKRLWPMSSDVRSKQFLKLFTDKDGNKQSIVQRVHEQVKEALPGADITIAANTAQQDSIRSHLGDMVDLVIEPERRDTFPAVALASAYLALEKKASVDDTVIVMPVDHYTEVGFYRNLAGLDKIIKEGIADLALIGIKPMIPTSKYGYIVPKKEIPEFNAFLVEKFVEKPEEKVAAELIDHGAYWNGGIFAFKLKYLMDIARADVSFTGYKDLLRQYGELEKTSFDYKVAEKAKRIAVLPYYGKWSDIGSWRTLADEMPESTIGRVIDKNNRNTFVINELDIPIIVLGTRNLVIAASEEGILVSDMMESSNLKPVVDELGSK